MKKIIAAATILLLCMAGTSSAFARGYDHGNYGGYSSRYDGGSHHHRYRGGHRNDGLGIAVGVVGGLLLGSALIQAAAPPPTVVYEAPPVTYRPSRICVEDRIVDGEWRVSRYDGRQVWVSFPYPVTRRFEVSCY